MHYHKKHVLFFTLILIGISFGCNEKKATEPIVIKPEPVSETAGIEVHIKNLLAESQQYSGKTADSIEVPFYKVLVHIYHHSNFVPLWSHKEKWNELADSLLYYLDTSLRDGLFKEDYGFSMLRSMSKTLMSDSVSRANKHIWAEADILFTNAFMHILQDLNQGRLVHDTLQFRNDTSKYNTFFRSYLDSLFMNRQLSAVTRAAQPPHSRYQKLKQGIRAFTDSMDIRSYTYLVYPYPKSKGDSVSFVRQLQVRLSESGLMESNSPFPDSSTLAGIIKSYQVKKKLTPDGKINTALIRSLNNTDEEKLKRIAITLDRFKELPPVMPERYIWVNLPAYKLEVRDADTVVLESRVICGKPVTPTPIITSAISDLVIYPTWTVPESIIAKEMLPGLKKNTGYLAKKGLHLINSKGETVDPATVSWEKYSKYIPYRIRQESGEDNALGVIKFNFSNPFAVYLHDTNQRYLFRNASRALSHGCVRVQEWEKLANYIIRNDSIRTGRSDSINYNMDSITTWIMNKERHRIMVKYQFPLFIRYFGCEVVNGKIKFHEDIYGSDKILRERFFSQKKI